VLLSTGVCYVHLDTETVVGESVVVIKKLLQMQVNTTYSFLAVNYRVFQYSFANPGLQCPSPKLVYKMCRYTIESYIPYL